MAAPFYGKTKNIYSLDIQCSDDIFIAMNRIVIIINTVTKRNGQQKSYTLLYLKSAGSTEKQDFLKIRRYGYLDRSFVISRHNPTTVLPHRVVHHVCLNVVETVFKPIKRSFLQAR